MAKNKIAESIPEIIAGEAAGKKKEDWYREMLLIASVIANRSAMLGVSPENVAQLHNEFNAYGKPIPDGNEIYLDLASKAFNEVQEKGPITSATFYATKDNMKYLPKGLVSQVATGSHHYFTDPFELPIRTAVGTKKIVGAARPVRDPATIDQAIFEAFAPVPTPRPVQPDDPASSSVKKDNRLFGSSLVNQPASVQERMEGFGPAISQSPDMLPQMMRRYAPQPTYLPSPTPRSSLPQHQGLADPVPGSFERQSAAEALRHALMARLLG